MNPDRDTDRTLDDQYADDKDRPTQTFSGDTDDRDQATISHVSAGETLTSAPAAPSIAGYRMIDWVGEGGMGTVWRAEQLSTKREVAIKVMRARTIGSRNALLRFEREIELAAMLQHPNIARVYDSGQDGDVYFYAMELIDGKTIDKFATAANLEQRGTVSLLEKVCRAVQHAHQNGIIHRDLKPSNILVSAGGEPHVLDFGLARTLVDDDSEAALTQEGEIAGTFAYMAPEQASGRISEIDTRSDVYALGVIAYELLAGRHPYSLRDLALSEALQVIQQQDPPPLSSVRRTMRGDLETIVATAMEKDKNRRYATAAALADEFSRYLNNEPIVARPASAWYQFAKFTRRNRTLVGGVAAVFVALVFGVIGTAVGLSRALDAERVARREQSNAVAAAKLADDAAKKATAAADSERKVREQLEVEQAALIESQMETEQQRAVAAAVNTFLTRLLMSADPRLTESGGGRDVTVAELLDRSDVNLDTAFADQPLVEAQLRHVIGVTYRHLGQHEKALPHLQREVELLRQRRSDDPFALMNALNSLAALLDLQNRIDEAEVLYQEALAIARDQFGDEHEYALNILSSLANLKKSQGLLADAADELRKVLALQQSMLGEVHYETLRTQGNLAAVLDQLNQSDEALKLTRATIDGRVKIWGEDHPDTIAARNQLAMQLCKAGRTDEAAKLNDAVIEASTRVRGEKHPGTLGALSLRAHILADKGELQEAAALFRSLVEDYRRVYGSRHATYVAAASRLGSTYNRSKQYDKAEAALRQAVEAAQAVYGQRHLETIVALEHLAVALFHQGRFAESEVLYRQLLESSAAVRGPLDAQTLDNWNWLTQALEQDKQYKAAVETFIQAVSQHQAANDDGAKYLGVSRKIGARAIGNLGKESVQLHGEGKLEEALAGFRLVLDGLRALRDTDEPLQREFDTRNWLGRTLVELKRYDEAIDVLTEAARLESDDEDGEKSLLVGRYWLLQARARDDGLRGMVELARQELDPSDPLFAETLRNYGTQLLMIESRPAEAVPLFREALRLNREHLGDTHPSTLDQWNWLGKALLIAGQPVEAASVLAEGVDWQKKAGSKAEKERATGESLLKAARAAAASNDTKAP